MGLAFFFFFLKRAGEKERRGREEMEAADMMRNGGGRVGRRPGFRRFGSKAKFIIGKKSYRNCKKMYNLGRKVER